MGRTSLLLAVAAAAAAIAAAATPATEWTLNLLTDAVAYGARSIDGSPAAVYTKPGVNGDENKWILFWEGGGWCTSPESCYDRSKTALGSSKGYAATTTAWSARDLLNPDCAVNPVFCTWSTAYCPYSDGQSRSGDLADPLIVNGTALYLRGYRNLEATLYALLNNKTAGGISMAHATDVLISGSSAGGLTTYLHADFVRDAVNKVNPATVVKAVPEVGFFIDGQSIWGTHEMTDAYQRAVTMANITGAASQTNAGCMAHYGPSDQWRCFMAQFVYPFVTVPTFVVNSKYDEWQLSNIWAPDPNWSFDVGPYAPYQSCINNPAKACNSTQYAGFQNYSVQFMSALNASLAATPASSLAQNGGIITSCDLHTTLVGGLSHKITVGNTTLYQAIVDWVTQSKGPGGSQYWTIDGSWPNNPTCAGPLVDAVRGFEL